jgi:hypothetical protein
MDRKWLEAKGLGIPARRPVSFALRVLSLLGGRMVPLSSSVHAFEARPGCHNRTPVSFLGSDPAAPGIPKSAPTSVYTNIMIGWREQ